MSKIILGFVGQIASGKGTAVAYLKEKYGASAHRFSSMLRDVLDRLYLEQSRENMQKISSVLRENFGEDTLAKVMAEDVKNTPNSLVAIDGIRRPADAKYLKEILGFKLIHIFADREKRYERIVARGENSDDRKKTFEEFKKDHEREAEREIGEIALEAIEQIDNNGSLEKLYEQLDQLVNKYGNQN
ncbi:MAG: AAA family ATPase [Patescibacteria group bacterium]